MSSASDMYEQDYARKHARETKVHDRYVGLGEQLSMENEWGNVQPPPAVLNHDLLGRLLIERDIEVTWGWATPGNVLPIGQHSRHLRRADDSPVPRSEVTIMEYSAAALGL